MLLRPCPRLHLAPELVLTGQLGVVPGDRLVGDVGCALRQNGYGYGKLCDVRFDDRLRGAGAHRRDAVGETDGRDHPPCGATETFLRRHRMGVAGCEG